ncbi:dTDP-4-dehydrorhamnose reductase [Methanothrix thermoacetophila]|uniref:dTDP-4-dehydrorhamnose reductase n=1 Tax=Methanothrix thermoacetophila (strain DSM 6194 / JCM 14653 / NBRC 101360 / PT) TaxID=349307 RepID=A0B7R7_METTP|nr:dTDP-4-dehydrorhamnose reductase [Methanothrix thermoacetophila]ABK14741.1 dTDP-4-dehydrorhamnose reductase [Methanothrix thermoacetophila PT]
MRILIFGAEGQLGTELCRVLGHHDLAPFSHIEADVADLGAVLRQTERIRPDVIINSAAYTDVDGCESARDKAVLVNAIGARNAAIAARRAGAKFVHISTDYVFDGKKDGPYVEYDPPNPLNVYGWSKLLGERMVLEQNPDSFILRVAWLYGPAGRNFVKTMLSLARARDELRVVNDQRGTPTFAGDVANQIDLLIETESYGLYHCTSQGECTWYEFAVEIFRLLGMDLRVVPVSTSEFPRPARRPANSVLDNLLLRVQGMDIMPHWRDSLRDHISEVAGRV